VGTFNSLKNRLIYIAPWQATFVRKDIDILSKHFRVLTPQHNWITKWMLPFTFFRQFIYLLFTMPRAHAVMVMFGGYWSFFPALISKLFGKRCYIILGGMDCVSFPNLHYGSLRKPVLKWFIGCSYRWSTRLLPVHESLVKSRNTYISNDEYRLQGFRNHFLNLKTPHTVMYNGFSVPDLDLTKVEKTPNTFILIAGADNQMRLKLKGIDHVLAVASSFTNCTFTIIGINPELTRHLTIPSNVTCHPFMAQSAFQAHLLGSQFVLQPSLSEGFPNAICEAMLYGCIPIGSNVGAIPLIMADTGVLIEKEDDLASVIRQATHLSQMEKRRLSILCRERILSNFSIARRENDFLSILT